MLVTKRAELLALILTFTLKIHNVKRESGRFAEEKNKWENKTVY